MFVDSFKYYKSRDPPPDLCQVIDVNNTNDNLVRKVITNPTRFSTNHTLGLVSVTEWDVYEFKNIPGLIFIKNPFTHKGQQYWILQCLREYSKHPNKINIDFKNILNDHQHWWDLSFRNVSRNRNMVAKLRWATLGYHHNWDTKVYSESSKSPMPQELSNLTKYFAEVTNFKDFNAEAAIVNYYRMNSTLAGHTDHSEINVKAPLFSLSFGQSAIFLIGGLTKEDPVDAIYLKSGDVLIMSDESRLRYHGVPKILKSETSPWLSDNDNIEDKDWEKAKIYINDARININVRQVLSKGQISL